ncbi:MAG: Trk system potassium transporter TrkA, partial [Desulfobacterales bacterium]|nr:Trk system potassium transporter TrkA [Desulfobacterales bacterium]
MKANKPAKSTNILILGLGGVGYYLAKRLAHEGYAITAIEPDSHMIRHADGDIDARFIQGDAMTVECWKEAGAERMDYLIAVTNNDAVNMMSCLLGDRFGIPRKIARVRSTEFGGEDSMLKAEDLKIDLIISPEELAVQEIFRLIKLRAGNDILDVAEEKILAMATRIHKESPLAHKKLKEVTGGYAGFPFRIVSIARGIKTLIPGGEDELLPGDQAFFMAGCEHMNELMALTGVEQQKRHKVMVIGGGLVGSRLAELLGKTFDVRLIEKNEENAKALSHKLNHTEILHGDGSDSNILVAAGLLDMDTFITAIGENETNIMSCVLAKHLMTSSESKSKQRKCISLVNKE